MRGRRRRARRTATAFVVTGAMTSLTGCSGEQFAQVLRSLGFVSQFVTGPALTPVEKPAEPVVEVAAPAAAPAAEAPKKEASAEEAQSADAEPADTPLAGAAVEEPTITGDAAVEAANEAAEAPASDEAAAPSEAPAVGASGLAFEFIGCEPAVAENLPAEMEEAREPAPRPLANGAASLAPALGDTQEILIEVWRPRPPAPRRSQRGGRERPSARGGAQGEPQASQGAGAPDEAGRRRRRPPARPPQGPAAEVGSSAKPQHRHFRGRPDRRPAENGEGAREPARAGEFQNSGRSRDERGRRERRPESAPAQPPRREAPVNLNSPFAKLLALKAQLETKGKSE